MGSFNTKISQSLMPDYWVKSLVINEHTCELLETSVNNLIHGGTDGRSPGLTRFYDSFFSRLNQEETQNSIEEAFGYDLEHLTGFLVLIIRACLRIPKEILENSTKEEVHLRLSNVRNPAGLKNAFEKHFGELPPFVTWEHYEHIGRAIVFAVSSCDYHCTHETERAWIEAYSIVLRMIVAKLGDSEVFANVQNKKISKRKKQPSTYPSNPSKEKERSFAELKLTPLPSSRFKDVQKALSLPLDGSISITRYSRRRNSDSSLRTSHHERSPSNLSISFSEAYSVASNTSVDSIRSFDSLCSCQTHSRSPSYTQSPAWGRSSMSSRGESPLSERKGSERRRMSSMAHEPATPTRQLMKRQKHEIGKKLIIRNFLDEESTTDVFIHSPDSKSTNLAVKKPQLAVKKPQLAVKRPRASSCSEIQKTNGSPNKSSPPLITRPTVHNPSFSRHPAPIGIPNNTEPLRLRRIHTEPPPQQNNPSIKRLPKSYSAPSMTKKPRSSHSNGKRSRSFGLSGSKDEKNTPAPRGLRRFKPRTRQGIVSTSELPRVKSGGIMSKFRRTRTRGRDFTGYTSS